MRRVGNAFVKTILRSPFHRLLDRSVMLLTFRGRRTGRAYTTPVMYATAPDGGLLVVPGHPERKRWWRNLQGGADVRVRLRGHEQHGVAEVLESSDARASAERAYLARFPRARSAFRDGHTPVVGIRIRPDAESSS